MVDMISRFMSPYQLNPTDANPMRDLLDEVVNFDRVRQHTGGEAISQRDQRAHRKGRSVFPNKEITADHVLASACLPFMMRAPDDRR